MNYVMVTVPAAQQTREDLAIMARFPGVFTTGTMRAAMTSDELAHVTGEREKGE
jgi:hypothetical protein